jgi:serine phosphatase RsbU (regulator of sigma subunit)
VGAVNGGPLEWTVAARPRRGETASGDVAVVRPFRHGALVAVIDGLGHGEEAAHAARLAATELEAHAPESVIALIRRCHTALRGTRGVVMSLASFNALDDTMTWLGVGNVEGLLVRAASAPEPLRETVLLRGGVVGYELPPLQALVVPVTPGDCLVFATDGVRNAFTATVSANGKTARQAEDLLSRYAGETDDALVLVARYLGL